MGKRIKDIIAKCPIEQIIGTTESIIETLVFDSRLATNKSIFFAIQGVSNDGHDFIPQVVAQGCKVIVAQKQFDLPSDITQIITSDTSKLLGLAASNFYDNPSKLLKLVGVTGTNGKTTTTTLLHNLFTKLGYHCGLLSTVVNKIGDQEIPSTHTTPNPVVLNQLLYEMVQNGCTHCFMEVSSHAVHQNRIAGLEFVGGVFTNITHDHLDYHKTFTEYLKVKKSFFDGLPKNAFALSNVDDKNGMVMLQNTQAQKATFGLKNHADYMVKVLENNFSGLILNLDGTELWTKLIGDFNAYNLLAVYAASILLGEDKTEVMTAISQLESVEGRFEYVQSEGGIMAIVDYAHTPDALENVLNTINNIRTGNETVFTVVGCGGDRDKEKRPKMANIACQKSNKVILTADNPRSEDANTIIAEMMLGVQAQDFKKTLNISDREQAIKTAISMAQKGDIILIAGKGHEKYQEIQGVKHPFDDLLITIDLFKKLEK